MSLRPFMLITNNIIFSRQIQQSPLRQQQPLSNPGADFYEISPRPFTLSPPAPSIHSFQQYTPRQPQLPPQRNQPISSNSFQRPTTGAPNSPQNIPLRFPNQPNDGNRFGEQVRVLLLFFFLKLSFVLKSKYI